MSEGFNRVFLMGNLGADPELRFTGSGLPVLNMRMATNETYVDKNREAQERTDWHSVVMWGSRAEALSKLLSKGDGVIVEGMLRTSQYEKDGEKRSRTEVVVRDLRFTGSRRGGHAAVEEPASPPPVRGGRTGTGTPAPAAMEQLPF